MQTVLAKSSTISRCSIALIYVWFGVVKLLALSPALQLVQELHSKTLGFLIPFDIFYPTFALFEILLGLSWLMPSKFTKWLFFITCLHLATTAAPLILLPATVWQSFLVPNLEGQYILKNILIFALALSVWSQENRHPSTPE